MAKLSPKAVSNEQPSFHATEGEQRTQGRMQGMLGVYRGVSCAAAGDLWV